MNKRPIISKKFSKLAEIDEKLVTAEELQTKARKKKFKKEKRFVMLKNELKKHGLNWNPNDDRIDQIDDISSSDSSQDESEIDYKWT